MEEEKRRKVLSDSRVIGTHSGTFHCDEALACFMLRQLPEYKTATILRSRDVEELTKNCDIIVDVGGKFEPEKKWFDHHQVSFKETLSSLRPELGAEFDKIRLSSAGLVYNFYGERVIENILKENANLTLSDDNLKLVFVQVYRGFISEIDAIDNGVPMFNDVEPLYKISTHLSSRIADINPSWDQPAQSSDLDKLFEKAMDTAGKEFVAKVMNIGAVWLKAREIVRKALLNSKEVYETGEILLLDQSCPWKAHLSDLEKECNVEGIPKLVIFSENPNSWRVQGVPVSPDSFLGRKFLPEAWRGLRETELSEKADVPDLIFVHHTGFIAGAKTKEAALKMAIKSVEWSL